MTTVLFLTAWVGWGIAILVWFRSMRTMRGFASFADVKARWSRATFGYGNRSEQVIEHIRRELVEVEAAPAGFG